MVHYVWQIGTQGERETQLKEKKRETQLKEKKIYMNWCN